MVCSMACLFERWCQHKVGVGGWGGVSCVIVSSGWKTEEVEIRMDCPKLTDYFETHGYTACVRPTCLCQSF